MAQARHVALLRGINVGGKNRVPMRALAELFEDSKCANVVTYIQSGNVAFDATRAVAAALPLTIAKGIAKRFGCDVPVVIRTAKELAAVLRGNPFLARGEDESTLHVLFLADAPSARAVKSLDAARSPPDEFAVRGREVYLFCPGGIGRSKLTNAWFDKNLATTSTGRNWRTVQKLAALAAGD